jgi:hypothetical protein
VASRTCGHYRAVHADGPKIAVFKILFNSMRHQQSQPDKSLPVSALIGARWQACDDDGDCMTTLNRQPRFARANSPLRPLKSLASLALLMSLGVGLTACATSPALFERGGLGSEASVGDTWAGAAAPRPSPVSSTVRLGSQPLLPPVPERQDGLAPIKISAYAN